MEIRRVCLPSKNKQKAITFGSWYIKQCKYDFQFNRFFAGF